MELSRSRSARRVASDLVLHFGNPDAGRTLPQDARSHLETVMGVDLSGVRVHIGTQPAKLGARAFAHGTDLYFQPEVYDPATATGLGEIAHELVHVCQQQRTQKVPASGTGAGSVSLVREATEEAQAERVARLVSRADPRARGVVRSLFGEIDRLSRARARWDIVQPNIHVLINGEYVHITNTNDALREIYKGCKDPEIKENFGRISHARMRPILHDWIHASTKKWKRFVRNQKEHTVQYDSWDNLARALLGEVRSRGNAEHEDYLAKQTVKSGWVNTQLAEFLAFCNECLTTRQEYHPAVEKIEQYKNYKGEYSHWYPFDGFKKVLANPGKYSFQNKIAVIHDLSKPFGKVADVFVHVPDEKCNLWALVPNGVRGYKSVMMPMVDDNDDLTFRDGSLGDDHLTLIEESEIIKTFRSQDSPVGFGPSFTTGRTAQLCYALCLAHGKTAERTPWISGIAWALFAFWNRDYFQQYSRAHTFHETMGMAYNYGVPYIPFTYPRTCPTTEDPYPTGDVL